jgi:hypothetical protein
MGDKPVDLEWFDPFCGAMTYERAMSFVVEKNQSQPKDEGRWRLPSSHELRIVISNNLSKSGLRQHTYMCRSSRLDGRISAISPEGKHLLFDPQILLHFCLVR